MFAIICLLGFWLGVVKLKNLDKSLKKDRFKSWFVLIASILGLISVFLDGALYG